MAIPLSPILSLFLLAVALLWHRSRQLHRSLPLPPGPKRWPVIGSLLQMPRVFEHETYMEWARQFGSDIIYMNVLGRPIIVIDKYETAVELLDKRGGIYSSRPVTPVLEMIPGAGTTLIHLRYGDRWRLHRRLFVQVINEKENARFESLIEKSRNRFLYELVETPEDWSKHVHFMLASTMFTVAYGLECASDDDPRLVRLEKLVAAIIKSALPSQFLVNIVLPLRHLPSWMPGGSFKKWVKPWTEEAILLAHDTYNLSKKRIDDGTAITSFVSESLQTVAPGEMTSEDEETFAQVAMQMYNAGTDTTGANVSSFILAMMLHPEVQRKGHEEISRVCDSSQLPSYDDAESLPYVTAIVLEVLRWTAAAPIGVPHSIDTDDIYNGYLIPGESIIMANIWSMTRNEEVYPEANSFKPERFIKDGALNKDVRDPREFVFGFGRRICPGRFMAYSTLWMSVAAILATLEIAKSDETVLPEDGRYFAPGKIISHPIPFKCSIKPRSSMSHDLIKSLQQ